MYDEIVALDLDVVASEANFLWLPFGEYAAVLGAYGERAGVVLHVFPRACGSRSVPPRRTTGSSRCCGPRWKTAPPAPDRRRSTRGRSRSPVPVGPSWRRCPRARCTAAFVVREVAEERALRAQLRQVAFESLEKLADIVARARRDQARRNSRGRRPGRRAGRATIPRCGHGSRCRDGVRRRGGSPGAPAEGRRRSTESRPSDRVVTDEAVDAVVDRSPARSSPSKPTPTSTSGSTLSAPASACSWSGRQTLRASLRGRSSRVPRPADLATSRVLTPESSRTARRRAPRSSGRTATG